MPLNPTRFFHLTRFKIEKLHTNGEVSKVSLAYRRVGVLHLNKYRK